MQTLTPSLTLAGPGLLLATSIIGFFLSWVTLLSLGQALLFGALISATDPVATIALFKELGGSPTADHVRGRGKYAQRRHRHCAI